MSVDAEVATPPPAPPPAGGGTYHTRLLASNEWAEGTPLREQLLSLPYGANGLPDPNLALIIVTETPDGQIVGIWSAATMVMLDGLWVDPNHRDSIVAGQLLRVMKQELALRDISTSFTLIDDQGVAALAHKAGFVRAKWDLWILDLPPAPEA